jgi:4-alpha-glucanotransferase
MTDAAIRDLARRAGISVEWDDAASVPQRVPVETLRRILSALGLPCTTARDLAHSRNEIAARERQLPKLITATIGEPIVLARGAQGKPVRLHLEDGTRHDLRTARGNIGGVALPPVAYPGYHALDIGERSFTLAVTPRRCHTFEDTAPGERLWGLAVQLYALRRPGDCGIGDMTAVAELAQAAARLKADALALSPMHALFTADPAHFSPYSPASRLFQNPLHADPRCLFGDARVASSIRNVGLEQELRRLAGASEIDWPAAARCKLTLFRGLFDEFSATDLIAAPATALALDFAEFRAQGGDLLFEHACFEALHGARLAADGTWDWRNWPAQWQNPRGAAVREFAAEHQREIAFHCFLQWMAECSIAAAHEQARGCGMRIGLIADVAVGTSSGGSHAWARQDDILVGLNVGAPPDLFNSRGQNWGLTTFSPRALVAGGFAPFIGMLRAGMRHAGGLRIDHAMGLMRLWVIPDGAEAREGAYLAYPLDDLLRLTALESCRHRAIVIGEDLGTVPAGFQDRLKAAGIAGTRVLWFERNRTRFAPPQAWDVEAAAMTSTHDLPTVAGWWRGHDIEVRERCGLVRNGAAERSARKEDRKALWRALRAAGQVSGRIPAPQATSRVVDACVGFVAHTPARLALIPLEDALALEEQPNVPGTIDEHPNWRRRYATNAGEMLNDAEVRKRLAALARRRRA